MHLDPHLQKLLESFVDLCDQVVERAFVVTNGLDVAGIVLQEDLAKHICSKIVNTYKESEREQAAQEWVVCSIKQTIKHAFNRGFDRGYKEAFQQLINSQNMKPSCEEVLSSDKKLVQESTKTEISFEEEPFQPKEDKELFDG